jgi:hypothetical protein
MVSIVPYDIPHGDLILIGHTFDMNDPNEPIHVNSNAIRRSTAAECAKGVVLTCRKCHTTAAICPTPGEFLFVVQHEAGCEWLTTVTERR